jgi:deoxyribonuclease-4
MHIGAHIPRESTIIKTMENIKNNGGNALQLFISNPRSSKISNYDKYLKESHLIKKYCKINNFVLIVHSPYTINLANPFINGKRPIDISDSLIINELLAANAIGVIGYVIHVGKYTTQTINDGLMAMKMNIKNIINEMINRNIKTYLLLENPAGQGTELLTDFNDFLNFYYSFTETERNYFKICIDTCHLWNAGYELTDISSMIPEKHSIVCIHANNSKNVKGAKLDRHECLFDGKIPYSQIKTFIENFDSIVILEQPSNTYNNEIKYLYS